MLPVANKTYCYNILTVTIAGSFDSPNTCRVDLKLQVAVKTRLVGILMAIMPALIKALIQGRQVVVAPFKTESTSVKVSCACAPLSCVPAQATNLSSSPAHTPCLGQSTGGPVRG